MEKENIKVKDIIIGEWYHLSGDLQNGNFITHEEVTRRITRVTDSLIYCECGRRFIINKKLKITIPNLKLRKGLVW